jgi:beta-galactosidase
MTGVDLRLKRSLLISAIVAAALVPLFARELPDQAQALSVSGTQFLLHGRSYQVISGAMHYARIPREYWLDRLRKARGMGLNTIETYVFWNLHEPRPGAFDFSGDLDVAHYVRLAQQQGLNVILRPGPYICSEWDLGGLPSWLWRDPHIRIRTKDPKFLEAADRYLMRVGSELSPLQASRGGPILMVQIENEYGSFGSDKEYLAHIRDTLVRAGFGESVLYTADGPAELAQGTLPDTLAVANFGPGEAQPAFAALGRFEPGKPLMSGEYWDGWFDSWGGAHARTNTALEIADLGWMLGQGYSVNLYMFHGGTTFGFMNGANLNQDTHGSYAPQTTSYDYDAPLDEAGRPTKKYFAFRDVIARTTGAELPDLPKPLPMIRIPEFHLRRSASLWTNLPDPMAAEQPQPMESYGQAYGYVLYRAHLRGPSSGELRFADLHDYASVYLDRKLVGELDRRLDQKALPIRIRGRDAVLDVLVENLGRINFGPHLEDDRKGIEGPVTFAGNKVKGWKIYPLPMSSPAGVKAWGPDAAGLAFHRGQFTLAAVGDTFLDVRSVGMGVVWVNGHNLGRAWSIGPQETLFVPSPWLKIGENEVVVFDSSSNSSPVLRGVTDPIWKQ